MSNVKLNKKRCQQGLDGLNAVYKIALDGMNKLYLEKEVLKNKEGNSIVEIDCVGGKVRVYVNAVNGVRPNNVKPIGVVDAIKLELVQPQVIEFIKGYLQKHLQSQYSDEFIDNLKVVSLEVNLTLPCVGGATPSDVIHLMDMALDKTVVFRKRKPNSKCDKVNTSCLYSKPKEYRLKIYDKSCEQHEKRNPLVEKNLLRIECILIDRRIIRAFGDDKRMLKDILTKQAIGVMCEEYKKIFTEDIIPCVKEYLNNARDVLYESLSSSHSGKEISDTICRHRELIADWEVMRVVLKKWYRSRGVEDRSKQMIHKYRQKELGIPDGVLQTIKNFHSSVG